jgi:trypsin
MQIKDVLVALAVPAICSAAAIPQDPSFPEGDFPEEHIVGGVAASAGDAPFIVSVQRSGSHFCGGSLLNANTVLTAAHCAAAVNSNPSGITVRAGSLNRNSGGVTASASSLKIHPSYSGTSSTPQYNNDVAIIKLSSSIATSSTIQYAVLAAAGSDPADGLSTTTAGWGTTTEGGSSPTALRKVDVPIISRATCRTQYAASRISDNMICAGVSNGGKDSCQGDSGGPLYDTSSKVLLGVVSWGDGCARAGAPGVYARVGSTSSFITANL